LALLIHNYDWDFAAAEREYLRAIELDPNSAWAHDFYGGLLDELGRSSEAIRQEQLAQVLDPGVDHLMDGFNHRGEYQRALEIALNKVATHPEDGDWHWLLYEAYSHTGEREKAVHEMERAAALYGYHEIADRIAKTYAKSGYEATQRLWAKELEKALGDPVSPGMIAEAYLFLGDNENALKWLERGYRERDGFITGLGAAEWEPLRSEPRFQDLVRRVGLP